MKHLKTLLFLCLISTSLAQAQFATISGNVTDFSSSETLIQATIYDSISGLGTITNLHGFYSLQLPMGKVNLICSYVGLEPQHFNFTLSSDTTLTIKLKNITELSEVVVSGNRTEIGVLGSQMSAIDVPIAQIKSIPALGGEIDVIKSLQLLPGVQSGSEGSTGLYVRGGGPDENLILLDGIPLYNINHMLGFFSVFNADAIKSITLYKGSFPARYGSRLSSVVDVRQNDGNAQSYHGSVTLGLLSAKLNVEGPIIKEKTTFNISARRTYLDILAQPILALKAKSDEKNRLMAGYYFYDINAKVSHKFSEKDRLSLSFYLGDDVVYTNIKESSNDYFSNLTESNKTNWSWGNLITMLNWNHQFTSKLFANSFVAYTRYRFNIALSTERKEETKDSGSSQILMSDLYQMKYKSSVDDWSFTANFDYLPHPNHAIKFGANYIFHSFRPAVLSMKTKYNEDGETTKDDATFGDIPLYSHEAALYIEDNWNIGRYVKMNMGLRGSIYAVTDKVYPSLEPRVSARILITNDLSAKASYSYMTQYIHLLSNSNLTLPTDLWVPVTKHINPMQSHQVAAGFFYNLLNQVDLSVEGYYKSMNNLLEYRDGASFLGSVSGWEDKVVMGRGWAYGVEFLAQRKIGKFTGWLGYTWSKTMRQFDRPNQEINFGRPFHAKYDRRHDLSITATYQFSKKYDLSATFIFGTGVCGTLGTQEYNAMNEQKFIGYDNIVTYIPERNNYRMPNYHRLDIGMNFYRFPKVGKSIWNISIYNVYNHLNPFMVYIGSSDKYNDRKAIRQISIFPIIPSVSYTYQF